MDGVLAMSMNWFWLFGVVKELFLSVCVCLFTIFFVFSLPI